MTTLPNLIKSAQRRLRKALERDCEAHRAEIAAEFQRMRRRRGLPPYVLLDGRWLRLPRRFTCPECGGRLLLEVEEYSTDPVGLGMPTAGGIRVMCEAEEEELMHAMEQDRMPGWEHRHWQSDWLFLYHRVERWCASAVRVQPNR